MYVRRKNKNGCQHKGSRTIASNKHNCSNSQWARDNKGEEVTWHGAAKSDSTGTALSRLRQLSRQSTVTYNIRDAVLKG